VVLSGDIFACHILGGATGTYGTEDKGMDKYPTTHKQPHNKELSSKIEKL
jgi:hypothetical protein